MTTLALSALIRPLLEPRLPAGLDVRWFATKEEALEVAPEAEIGWFDMYDLQAMGDIVRAATGLRWLNSLYDGLDFLPLDVPAHRVCISYHGEGIKAITLATYVVLGS